MLAIFCVKIQMSPLFNIIFQVTKYMPTPPRSTLYIYLLCFYTGEGAVLTF